MRIALMIIRNILFVPYYIIKTAWLGKHRSREEAFAFIKHVAHRANEKGRVEVVSEGLENLPERDGYVLFPNHQGMYDVIVFLAEFPRPFSFVAKKEVRNFPFVKQVMGALNAIPIDRKDLRQSMHVIQEMTKRVDAGENFLIFAEGTRSKMGNKMNEMKGGSFKSAVKAKAPIVPVALMDSFVPFDENSIKKVKVRVFYLPPIYYDEYKDMSTQEIASMVKSRIEAKIAENS
ncbi:MAG: 1-acyl-sn-glycerol-3-phosphate acyltransferase [Lachnospiraceae bacterium]|jgi:1-acyl-sn-glycerol-3-phosphate acyltransferase|nr:1-acyl-sn-glycerol-3-phosphate acyltransferase [Lachnospiraceae bacterium]